MKSPRFQALVSTTGSLLCHYTEVAALLRQIGLAAPIPVQSMYIFKQPSIGGEVVPHQDSTFLHSDPMTCTGIWLALEECTKDNGCLWAKKASHNDGIARRMVRRGK